MSLTTGRGPLSAAPAGRFNKPVPEGLSYVEPHARRVRGIRGQDVVVDSERVLLVHRQGLPATYAFPEGDVGNVPTEAEPLATGYVRVPWDAADTWYEEEEPVLGHPRSPYHRVDCIRTARRLRVELAGTVLVDTTDTVGVYETGLPPRLYVNPAQVRDDLLVESPTRTYCPYKGTATYWTAVSGDVRAEDVAWSYEDPFPECERIRGHLSFYEDRIGVLADLPGRSPTPGE